MKINLFKSTKSKQVREAFETEYSIKELHKYLRDIEAMSRPWPLVTTELYDSARTVFGQRIASGEYLD